MLYIYDFIEHASYFPKIHAVIALLGQIDHFKVMPATTFTFSLKLLPSVCFGFMLSRHEILRIGQIIQQDRLKPCGFCVCCSTVLGSFMNFLCCFSFIMKVNRLGNLCLNVTGCFWYFPTNFCCVFFMKLT